MSAPTMLPPVPGIATVSSAARTASRVMPIFPPDRDRRVPRARRFP